MRQSWKTLALRAVAISGAIFGTLVLLLLFAIGTAPGHAVIAWLITPLTGGDIAVRDLSGSIPNHLQAGSVELRDTKGVWLRIENVQLDWRALSLFDNHIDIARARADRVVVLRWPAQRKSESSDLRVDVSDFRIVRIEIAPAAVGKKAVLTASGSVHYASSHDTAADIVARRLDGDGFYRMNASIRNDIVRGTATIAEKDDGIAGGIVGLTDLGPVSLVARASATNNSNNVTFDLRAGALKASGRGTIDLVARNADVEFSVSAPAMRPRPDLSWTTLAAHGRMDGSFDRPRIDATFTIQDFAAAGFSANRLNARLQENQGTAEFAGVAESLKIPGDEPDIFAAAPVRLSARANLEAGTRPIVFALDHPLLQVKGLVNTRGPLNSTMTLNLPLLAPFATLVGIDLDGHGSFSVKTIKGPSATAIVLSGAIDADGETALARLLGHHATINLSSSIRNSEIISAQGAFIGAAASAHVTGTTKGGALKYRWDISVSDVSRIASTLLGTLNLRGTFTGAPGNSRLAVTGEGLVGTKQFVREKISIALNADGLPKLKNGDFRINGRFDGAPLIVLGRLARDHTNALNVTLERTEWKSANAQGSLVIPTDSTHQHGTASLHINDLADVAPLLGVRLEGAFDADINVHAQNGRMVAKLRGSGRNLQIDAVRMDRLDIDGEINDPLGKPVFGMTIAAAGLRVQDISGTVNASLDGPLQNLAFQLSSDASTPDGEHVSLNATAVADMRKSKVVLNQLHGAWKDRTLALLSPATIDFSDGIIIDRLRLGFGGAHVDLAGRISPDLALTVSADGVTPDMLPLLVDRGVLDGTLSATAKLAGTLQSPEGSFELHGRGLRMRGTSERTFPAAALDAHGTLRNFVVVLDARLDGNNSLQLVVKGDVPLERTHPLNLRASGNAELGVLGAVLAAEGQNLTGKLALDTTIAGTISQPRITGSIKLTGGEFRDYANGLRLRDIDGLAEAQGDIVHISQMSARAGQGTITGSGIVNLAAPGFPVEIAFVAKDARPFVSDRVTATLDANLKLEGQLIGQLALSGDIRISQGEIKIPDNFPPNVAILDVRRKGEHVLPPVTPKSVATLDLTISASSRVFVRGRGLDAELAGRLKIAGVTANPQIIGALDMRRGTLSLAGRTLEFRSGKVSFDGSGLKARLDPTLDFIAETNSSGVTATLKVTGYASAPQVQLLSSPSLPQDEILARLLFQQSVKQLTPLQLTEIAEAIASLSGLGAGFNPVGALRKSLGLDRLAVGSTSSANGGTRQTTIEAGKYVTHNVYIGAKQDLSGGTRVVGEVDITKNLKAQASVNAGTPATVTSTPLADNGDSVGLSYQFEY